MNGPTLFFERPGAVAQGEVDAHRWRPGLWVGRSEDGFTLIELLVAAAVTLLLAGLMITVVTNVLSTWNRCNGALGANNQAEQALDRLAQDLQTAVLRRAGRVWFAATVQPEQTGTGDCGSSMARWSTTGGGTAKPGWSDPGTRNSSLDLVPASGRIEDVRFGMAGVWLRLVVQVSDDNSAIENTSAPRAIAYQLVRHAVGSSPGATVRYSLFRSEVRPSHTNMATSERSTFFVGCNLFAAPYNEANVPIPGSSQTSQSGDREPGGLRRPDRTQRMADNVIDFGVRCYARNAAGELIVVFPVSQTNLGFAATTASDLLPPAGASSHRFTPGEMTYGFPEIVEVALRILTEEGAQQIDALESGRLVGPAWWDLALAHSRVFVWRVLIETRPL